MKWEAIITTTDANDVTVVMDWRTYRYEFGDDLAPFIGQIVEHFGMEAVYE